MQNPKNNVKRDKGLTLVEMVIAMSIMTVVFTAMVPVLAGIRGNWSARQANTEIVQNARVLADHMHRTLATAERIASVSSPSQERGHITFVANDGQMRGYAVAEDGYVQFGRAGRYEDLAGPVSRLRFTCYDGSDFTTPTVDAPSIRFVSVEMIFPKGADLGMDKTFIANVFLRAESLDADPACALAPGIALKESLTWGEWDARIDSYRSSEGPYDPARCGAEAVVSVNAATRDTIRLWTNAVIRGDAYIGPGGDPDTAIVTAGTSSITGRRAALDTPIEIPDLATPTDGKSKAKDEGALELGGSQSVTIDSNRYFASIRMSGGAVLVVKGHVAIVVQQDVEINDRAELRILPDSSATFHVKRGIRIAGDSKLNSLGHSPSRLRICMTGSNNDFEMTGSAVAHAVLENPRGQVAVRDRAEFFGKIRANRLDGGGRIHVDLDCEF